MRYLFLYLIVFSISLYPPFYTAFAQDISPQPLNTTHKKYDKETAWENKINILIKSLNSSEQDSSILRQVEKIILWEFEKNVLFPPILNKNRTAKKRKRKFVRLINTMIKVAKKLEDDSYLDHILIRLSSKIFGIREHDHKILFSSSKLQWVKNLFKGLDKELREAVFEINDPNVTDKFYTKFYFQLIKIDNFLNHIYEYEDQRPFESFIDRLDKDRLEVSFKEIQNILAKWDFVNAEDSLSKLFIYYYERRGINIWEPTNITLSKNLNIPTFVRTLHAHKDRFKESYNYGSILHNILNYIDNKEYMIKKTSYKIKTYYDGMLFFSFAYKNLLLPEELKKYPFKSKEGAILQFDKLIDEKARMILDSEDMIFAREKVDGTLRQMYCDKLLRFDVLQASSFQLQSTDRSSFKDLTEQKYILKNVLATIFLPNSPYNNVGNDFSLYEYNKFKLGLFLKLKNSLLKTHRPQKIVTLLISMLRLNKSYRSGALQLPFYSVTEDIYRNYFDRLKEREKKKLILEKLRLGFSDRKIEGKNNQIISLKDLLNISNDIIKTYKITPPTINTLSDVITLRSTSGTPKKKARRIGKERENIFFLLSNLKNLLNSLDNRDDLELIDPVDIYTAMNSILDIYHHYLPFIDNIDAATILDNKNALLLMTLINNDNINYPFLVWNKQFLDRKKYPEDQTVTLLRNKIISKLIMHNFLGCEVVFHLIENNRIEALNIDQHFKFRLLDFDLLIPIPKTKKISTRNLIKDIFDGFTLNSSLLTNVDDEFIHQYIFKNITERYESTRNSDAGLKINCFDDMIRRALKIKTVSSPVPFNLKIDEFVMDQRKSLSDLYGKLNSVFSIQKLWETILVNVTNEESNKDKTFSGKYSDFYLKAHFLDKDMKNAKFKKNIKEAFVKNFYAYKLEGKDLAGYLSDLFRLCNGENKGNWGLKGVIDKYRNIDPEFGAVYKNALIDLMTETLGGAGLKPREWFISQMFHDNQANKNKPITDFDLFSDDFFQLYESAWESAYEFADYPEIRRIYVDDDTWNKHANVN